MVEFPLELEASSVSASNHNVDTKYELTGIVNHEGSLSGGHYVAYCKNSSTKKWYLFNDSRVSEVSESQVLHCEAYILFYQKVSPSHLQEVSFVRQMLSEPSLVREPLYYVPSKWYNEWRTLSESEIGPLENELVCQHQKIYPLSLDVNTSSLVDRFVAVPSPVWKHWVERYGGGAKLEKLEICESCKQEIFELEKRRKEEHENVCKFDSLPKEENEPLFLVEIGWVHEWMFFICNEKVVSPPGAIPNSKLLSDNGKPKPNISIKKDYRVVRQATWDYIHRIYGGGPAIQTKDLEHSSL